MSKLKEYLGDGVYVDFDGYSILLTTENGYFATNTIVLEPNIMTALDRYYKSLPERISASKPTTTS